MCSSRQNAPISSSGSYSPGPVEQDTAFLQQGGHETERRHTAVVLCGDQHTRNARMQRKSRHAVAHGRDVVLLINRTQIAK